MSSLFTLCDHVTVQLVPGTAHETGCPLAIIPVRRIGLRCVEHGRFRLDEVIVHGDDLLAAAALGSLVVGVLVGQEVLERTEQKRPQSCPSPELARAKVFCSSR